MEEEVEFYSHNQSIYLCSVEQNPGPELPQQYRMSLPNPKKERAVC